MVWLHDELQNLLGTRFHVENVIMKAKLKGTNSYLMKFITYELLFSKNMYIFQKSISYLKNMNGIEILQTYITK